MFSTGKPVQAPLSTDEVRTSRKFSGDGIMALAVKGKALLTLREKTLAFMTARMKAKKPIAIYQCPICDASIAAAQPRKDEANSRGCWDSLRTCTNCGGVHFAAVYPDGSYRWSYSE